MGWWRVVCRLWWVGCCWRWSVVGADVELVGWWSRVVVYSSGDMGCTGCISELNGLYGKTSIAIVEGVDVDMQISA